MEPDTERLSKGVPARIVCGAGKTDAGSNRGALRAAGVELCRAGPARQSTGPLPASAWSESGDPRGDLFRALAGDGDQLVGGAESGSGVRAAGSELSGAAFAADGGGCWSGGVADGGGVGGEAGRWGAAADDLFGAGVGRDREREQWGGSQ